MTIAASFPIKEKVAVTSAGGATEELEFEVVPPGRYRRYERIAGIDPTTAYDKIRIVARSGGVDYLVSEDNTITEDVLYWDTYALTLKEGDQLVIQMLGTTADDALAGYALGFEGALGDL